MEESVVVQVLDGVGERGEDLLARAQIDSLLQYSEMVFVLLGGLVTRPRR